MTVRKVLPLTDSGLNFEKIITDIDVYTVVQTTCVTMVDSYQKIMMILIKPTILLTSVSLRPYLKNIVTYVTYGITVNRY